MDSHYYTPSSDLKEEQNLEAEVFEEYATQDSGNRNVNEEPDYSSNSEDQLSAHSIARRLGIAKDVNDDMVEGYGFNRTSTPPKVVSTAKALSSFSNDINSDSQSNNQSPNRTSLRQTSLEPTLHQQESTPTALFREKTTTSISSTAYTYHKRKRYHNEDRLDQDENTLVELEPVEIILAINYKQKKLGCAYYSFTDGVMYLMDDCQENESFDLVRILDSVNLQISPSVIISCLRADESFLSTVGEFAKAKLKLRPSTEFSFQSGKNKLVSLKISKLRSVDSEEKYLYLSTFASITNNMTIGCVSALLSHLNTQNVVRQASVGSLATFEILDVQKFSLYRVFSKCKRRYHRVSHTLSKKIYRPVAVTGGTSSLQIFEEEAHPNMHMQLKNKEGVSLFGILNETKSSIGNQLLRLWLLRPSRDLEVINERLDITEFFLRPESAYLADQLRNCLKQIRNVPRVMERLLGRTTVHEWQFVYNCLRIGYLINEMAGTSISLFLKMHKVFAITDFKNIGAWINDLIDFDESLCENRVVVKSDVDESHVAVEISRDISTDLAQNLNVVYFPQLGYLIAVPFKRDLEENNFTIESLEFQFCTTNTIYYKNSRMKELDKTIGDIHGSIIDREIEIIQSLQQKIVTYRPMLIESANLCAELDCNLALTSAARKYNYTRPYVTQENVIKIKKGRHPLQELATDVFVTNDTWIDGEKRITILSGSNNSGKSVYLKQIAMITYMAHIGCFVPAEAAVIGLTDKIFTRVQTKETVSKVQSAFMYDLQQVALATQYSTSRSLLLFDEFGKGTVRSDGIGLFCSLINHLANRRENCPKVIAATHFLG
ncbi:hypothetical protein K7432_010054 [Basidiobolus ranarum]|uniref:DNA mismatch repair proteins mutS family domain-containing protein n=1 Tax=Basidiobolus ranarum TaxID=34480 RepID=A0ABR2VW81_9FUNG